MQQHRAGKAKFCKSDGALTDASMPCEQSFASIMRHRESRYPICLDYLITPVRYGRADLEKTIPAEARADYTRHGHNLLPGNTIAGTRVGTKQRLLANACRCRVGRGSDQPALRSKSVLRQRCPGQSHAGSAAAYLPERD